MRRAHGLALALIVALAALAPAAASAAPTAALPSCAEGPEQVGTEVVGTPCDDRIVAPAGVSTVDAGPGDDVILGANSAAVPAAIGSPETGLHLEVGSQTFEGGAGSDVVFGDRGNDRLRGGPGNDRLYGGIGDDTIEGGEGDDLISGGFGGDRIDGGAGGDYVRGDGTIDYVFDSGAAPGLGGGVDTLSFATAGTPGFGVGTGVTGFQAGAEGRGVYLQLAAGGENADNGAAAAGGGHDEIQPGVFERVVGSPFADYILGSGAPEEIYGGGGADVIRSGGGGDTVFGGADGDYVDGGGGAAIDGGPGVDNCIGYAGQQQPCSGSATEVHGRDPARVSVGETVAGGLTQVYLVGGSGTDSVSASFAGSSVSFTLSSGSFDPDPADNGGCSFVDPSDPTPTAVTCPLPAPLDSVLLAGVEGDDSISAPGFPDGVSLVELGGAGADSLSGGGSEDVLVDGPGTGLDFLAAGAGDDALVHNEGADVLDGGEGSDLFFSAQLCKGATMRGGIERIGAPTPDRDNASWAKLGAQGVAARLDLATAGRIAGEVPSCPGEALDRLEGIEDLEGSNQSDVLYGNEGENQLLGHRGSDTFRALGGSDSILANSGSPDRLIDCGAGFDRAVVDLVSKAIDPVPIECENVREGAPEEFDELPLLTPPPPAPVLPPAAPAPVKPAPRDRVPPRTELRRHPAKALRVRAGKRKLVAFRFGSSEAGSSFRCRLDRGRYARCRSPRSYRVGPGRHAFRLFAVDAAGNRDPSPALFKFRVVAVGR